MTNDNSESRPETELKQEVPPSSSSTSEELLGFTPASEIYSVGIVHIRVFCFSFCWLWSSAVSRLYL